jgi:hypothetical protein
MGDKSPLRHQQQAPAEGLTEVSLDDGLNRLSSEADTDTTATAEEGTRTPPPAAPPELPPRKRGSAPSASSETASIQGPPPVPPRRGAFARWLRSGSMSSKSSAPPLPPRPSIVGGSTVQAPSQPNIDLLIARLEEQSKLIREDEKAREEYEVGSEELRKSFERIQREHQPPEGEDDEIDWGKSWQSSF